MRKTLALSGLVLLLLLAPGRAPAQIPVTDLIHIGVNTYWHIAHWVQFATQVINQYEQIRHQVQQIENELTALRSLSNPNWREVASLLQTLDGLLGTGRSLAYTLQGLDGLFRQTFPGWHRWDSPDLPQQQVERALDTMRANLVAIQRQAVSLPETEQSLADIRGQMATLRGTGERLELLATVQALGVQESLLTRQSIASLNNMVAVQNAYALNREAQATATFNALAFESSLALDQNSSTGFTARPAWWPFL